ncbi:MAG: bifunctional phosphoribosylaminoimidazolecarboxamide formyltransferase/IMP cyclohydrolase PurH [Alphaproteobacteria bacterium]|nr:bifunctional phosphoribosylaminoimidazolecarboxamide formyltransferase/IMP cyclohydrolase PurH [Alphaproteobacteria bacterium]
MTIKRALISVSDKTGLLELAAFLHSQNIEILSTGGTAKALRDAKIPVIEVSDHTGFPEIMDGRVKTLQPKIHGGILAIRGNAEHEKALATHGIAPIDLVVINLYPFEQAVAGGGDFDHCIENIDIGGPSMVRGAAKNHAFVTIIVYPADYAPVMAEIKVSGDTSLATRKRLAAAAYSRTAAYDSAISNWFNGQNGNLLPDTLTVAGIRKGSLNYGENPHQKAAYYVSETGPSLGTATLAQGTALSYNNLNDASAAFELVREFEGPAVAIIKHANPCGVAIGSDVVDAFTKALACDPISAYGGIIAINRPLTFAFAQALGKLFLEVIIAPSADDDALAALSSRKKLRLLLTGEVPKPAPKMTVKTISGGFLYQEEDLPITLGDLKTATKTAPTSAQMEDLLLAFTIAKHVKSNTIVLVRGGTTIGIGAGQMSRIDSTRIACWKAKEAGLDTKGAVLASDAFFPFADNVEMAAEAGISAIIQPGGSIRDEEVIAAADKAGIPMVFTGIRHFRH